MSDASYRDLTGLPEPQVQGSVAIKVPCVCSTSPNNRQGRVISFSVTRGHLVEYVVCEKCGSAWQRHNY